MSDGAGSAGADAADESDGDDDDTDGDGDAESDGDGAAESDGDGEAESDGDGDGWAGEVDAAGVDGVGSAVPTDAVLEAMGSTVPTGVDGSRAMIGTVGVPRCRARAVTCPDAAGVWLAGPVPAPDRKSVV